MVLRVKIQFRNKPNTTIAINGSLANEFRVYLLATNHLIRSDFVSLSYSVLSLNQITSSSINYNVNGTNRQYLACVSIASDVTYSGNYTFRMYRW